MGQICLCAVSGNKQNGNEVKRKENKHIHKENTTVLKVTTLFKKCVFANIYFVLTNMYIL